MDFELKQYSISENTIHATSNHYKITKGKLAMKIFVVNGHNDVSLVVVLSLIS